MFSSCIYAHIIVTELPRIMFEFTELYVLENVDQATIVCVRLISGTFTSQQATFDIFTQPGSAQGML